MIDQDGTDAVPEPPAPEPPAPRPPRRRRKPPPDQPPPTVEPAERPAPEEPSMDIHKPKPVHNLREFLGEIAIIVTGVLIALTLEQVVEAWHWRHQVENAETALGKELSETIGQGDERIRVSACVDHRLDEIAAIVDGAAESGRLPPVGDIAMPPGRTWSSSVWASTLAGQTGEHLTADRRNAFSVIYGFEGMLSSTNSRELDIWTRLYSIVGPGRALQPEEAAELRRTVSEARSANQMMGLGAVRLDQLTAAWPIGLDEKLRATFVQPRDSYAICRPIGGVPEHYGTAPIAGAIERARASPIGHGHAGKAVTGATGK